MQSEEEELADKYKVHPRERDQPGPASAHGGDRSLEGSLKALDRHRTKMYRETDKKKQALEAAPQAYRDANAESDALSGLTVERIESAENEFARDLGTQEPGPLARKKDERRHFDSASGL